MSVPNSKNKYQSASVFTAADVLANRRNKGNALRLEPPEAVIFCFQPTLIDYALKRFGAKKVNGFYGDLYLLKKTGNRVAVACNFGIGAPVVAALTEELAAFGVRHFVSIGLAGGLQPGLRAGDLIVCNRAIRDEGTSHHYLPPSKYTEASASIVAALASALDDGRHRHLVGASWTTDAPYRETRGEVEQYRREGVSTVEMEAAALFAVGEYLQIPVGAAFVIGDTFDGARWQLDFDARAARRGLETLLDTTVAALQRLESK